MTLTPQLPDDLMQKLSWLGDKIDESCEKALEKGAEAVKKEVTSSLSSAIGRTKYPSKSTGELQRSLGISKVKQDKSGSLNIKVGFSEPRKGSDTPNALIASVLEYGKQGQEPTGFMKKAKNKAAKEAKAIMEKSIEEDMKI